jgi:hypothetical protein
MRHRGVTAVDRADDRPFLAAAFGDPAETLPEERVGSAGHDRRLAQTRAR